MNISLTFRVFTIHHLSELDFNPSAAFLNFTNINQVMENNSTLKRLRNRYRMVILNEDTYEEVTRFRLSRWGVYTVFSVLFILMTGLTAALIIFTPLKYYLPGVGMGSARQVKELRELKMRTDSMEHALRMQDNYLNNIQKVLSGKVISLDTNKLSLPKLENSDD